MGQKQQNQIGDLSSRETVRPNTQPQKTKASDRNPAKSSIQIFFQTQKVKVVNKVSSKSINQKISLRRVRKFNVGFAEILCH